jgi:hypothetical protein
MGWLCQLPIDIVSCVPGGAHRCAQTCRDARRAFHLLTVRLQPDSCHSEVHSVDLVWHWLELTEPFILLIVQSFCTMSKELCATADHLLIA